MPDKSPETAYTTQPNESEFQRFRLEAGTIHPNRSFHSSVDNARRYHCTLVQSGENKNGWILPLEVLGAAINKFSGVPCLLDHMGWFEHPKIQRMAGSIETPMFQDDAAVADLRIWDTPNGDILRNVLDAWLADRDAGLDVPDIGLSAVLWLKWAPRDSWDDPLVCTEIKQVESVDAVFYPAAGGQVERVLNSVDKPALLKGQAGSNRAAMPVEISWSAGANYVAGQSPGRSTTMPEEVSSQPQEVSQETSNNGGSNGSQPPAMNLDQALQSIQAVADRIEALTGQVDRLTAVVADQEADRVITGMGAAPQDNLSVRMGRTGLEQVELALDALLEGTRPPEGIQPLTGIRELYMLLSGDYELTGRYHQDRVYLLQRQLLHHGRPRRQSPKQDRR